MAEIELRAVEERDLDTFFLHEQNKEAQHMAAFIPENPSDKSAFDTHWNKIMNNKDVIVRTILYSGTVVGHIAKFVMFNEPELTYWIDHNYWGRGIATESLRLFLKEINIRPIYARTAKDNIGSTRVLEKCGFKIQAYEKGFANARGKEIEELVLKLD